MAVNTFPLSRQASAKSAVTGWLIFIASTLFLNGTSLADPVDIKLSNEEQKIAYLQYDGNYWQVWIMNIDGSNKKAITQSAEDKVHIEWGPHNQSLLYNTNIGKTIIHELDTEKETLILTQHRLTQVGWRPDGKQFAYGIQPPDLRFGKIALWVSDADGKSARKIAGGQAHDSHVPAWLPDGSGFVFRQCTIVSNMQVHHQFWMGDSRGKVDVISGDDETLKFDYVISSQGQIAYSSANSGYYELWVMDLKTQKPMQYTEYKAYTGNPSWAPNDNRLVFDSDKDGTTQIYTIDLNTNKVKRLTEGKHAARKPSWSKSS